MFIRYRNIVNRKKVLVNYKLANLNPVSIQPLKDELFTTASSQT